MLILILIDVQYLRNVVFNFEKGSNGQNYSTSDSHYLIKNSPREISHVCHWGVDMLACSHFNIYLYSYI